MMWWRRRRIRLPPTLEEQRKIKEAKAAAATAEEMYRQVQEQGAEVRKVAGLLRSLRQENNFAVLVQRSMRRRA